MFEDYWKTLNYVEKIRSSDGTGGYEYVYKIGEEFQGSVVKSGSQEQIIAGIRGETKTQYTISTFKKNVLLKDDVIMFINDDKQRIFLRINSDINYTPENSGQRDWKYTTATEFEPDLRVVEK